MRVPVYLVCAALVIAVRAEDGPNYLGRLLEPVNVAADQETISYLLPKLAAKYRPNSEWSGVTDPRFYVLTEMESNDIDNEIPKNPRRNKRYGELSITAPIHSLREMFKSKILRQKTERNRKFLENLQDLPPQ